MSERREPDPVERPFRPLVSVVCPIFREEQTIKEFYRRATEVLESVDPGIRHEIVFVNDGSDDGSGEQLRAICAADQRAKLVDLSRNFGHQLAITSGIDHATGDAVVVMDGDLQDPPEVIPAMVERWRQGFDVVYGRRSRRKGEPRLMLAMSALHYRLINRLSDTNLPLDTGDFRLMDVAVVDVLRSMREENRYIRGLVSWIGFHQTSVPYVREARFAGKSRYGLMRRVRFAFDGLTSFSERPLRFASALGAIVVVMAMALAVYIVVAKIVDPDRSIQGYASVMVAILFFGGVQLLSVGLLGEYVGRIYRESKQRPLYVVRDRVNCDSGDIPP